MKKVLIAIQGKTIILQYLVKPGLVRNGTGWATYIEVLPSSELSQFNLKGLTPEMFCVNISDMVNVRGIFAGTVENEKQIPVARYEINQDDYLRAISNLTMTMTHLQIVNMLKSLPDYIQEWDNQFVDFEEIVVPQNTGEPGTFSGYRLTIVTEDMGDKAAPYAFYNLDTHTPEGWQGYPPPQTDYEPVRIALTHKLQAISDAGVQIKQVYDETDYAIAG